MMRRMVMTLALLGLAAVPEAALAQRGGLPADEWAITLESGRRMEGLEIAAVVDRLGLKAGDVVADIGAGTGIFSLPMALEVGPTGAVLAVEVDAGFLPMIERKARLASSGNLTAVLGEYTDPKLPRHDVDLAFFHDVLHHIDDRAAYLKTMAGYMAPGGRIAVVDYDGSQSTVPHQDVPELLITRPQVDEWMRAAGFRPSETIRMFDDKFYVIYTREG